MSTRRFTFIVRGERHIIVAATALDAMTVANRGLPLPVNFYAWMEAGTDTFQATTGVWD